MDESPEAPADLLFSESAGRGREVKFGEMLESLIERGGYARNRKKISSRLGISGAALSQYIRQQTWPSFSKLLALADFFDVSLDYLVYGQPTSPTDRLIDYGPIYRYVDHALADVQARGNRHSAVVARIGRVLADRIDSVAEELASAPAAAREGLLQDDEILRLERYCREVDLVTLDLEYDVIRAEGGELAAGRFLPVVAANLEKGTSYRFLLPRDRAWDKTVEACRRFLADHVGGDQVRENCAFRLTAGPVFTGVVLYHLDTAALERQEPALYAQIQDHQTEDARLGCIIRPNNDSNSDILMSPANARRAMDAFDLLWASGTAV
jgi:transcriptional regulator with XRE-family HTH domain